jgi:hypothetical protein
VLKLQRRILSAHRLRWLRNRILTSATVALAAQAKIKLKIPCAGLRNENLTGATVALAAQRNFKWRNRCAACATDFYLKNSMRWAAQTWRPGPAGDSTRRP